MDKFPAYIENPHAIHLQQMFLQSLRKKIHDYIVHKTVGEQDPNDFMSLSDLKVQYNQIKWDVMKPYINLVRNELIDLGWKSGTSRGGTALFIFRDEPPQDFYSEDTDSDVDE